MMLRKKVVIQAPRRVVVLGEELLPPEPHEVLVDTLYSAVSAGTEMLAYRGEMPPEISADATISGLQKPFGYPIAYGYAAVGRVSSVGASVKGFSPGELVFGFREHCSAFCAPASSLLKVPDGIDPKNACMLPSVETAVSIATDATLLPGESAVVVGQGAIGLLTVAVLKLLHPFSVVVGVELSEARRRLSVTCANADACFGAEAGLNSLAFVPHFDPAGADVAIDTSGAAAGLDTAIRLTRDAGAGRARELVWLEGRVVERARRPISQKPCVDRRQPGELDPAEYFREMDETAEVRACVEGVEDAQAGREVSRHRRARLASAGLVCRNRPGRARPGDPGVQVGT